MVSPRLLVRLLGFVAAAHLANRTRSDLGRPWEEVGRRYIQTTPIEQGKLSVLLYDRIRYGSSYTLWAAWLLAFTVPIPGADPLSLRFGSGSD